MSGEPAPWGKHGLARCQSQRDGHCREQDREREAVDHGLGPVQDLLAVLHLEPDSQLAQRKMPDDAVERTGEAGHEMPVLAELVEDFSAGPLRQPPESHPLDVGLHDVQELRLGIELRDDPLQDAEGLQEHRVLGWHMQVVAPNDVQRL